MTTLIQQIESILKKPLVQEPTRNGDPLANLMPVKKNTLRYALDEQQHIVGLNLAYAGLNDATWKKILALPGLAEPLLGLNLSGNQLTQFPFPEGKGLRRLEQLRLAENQLRNFALPEGFSGLIDLDLEENPLENPGPELMAQGKAAVLRTLLAVAEQGVQEVYEAKLLFVGEGDAGKTTLWNLIQDPVKYEVTGVKNATIGVEIKEGWEFQHPDTGQTFYVNLWDFGGQDEQYMTHQFFLTQRSLYVLLANARGGDPNFPYWLKTVSLFGCEEKQQAPMPLLVVLNQKGGVSSVPPYNSATVATEYPRLRIVKHELDLAKKGKLLEALIESIQQLLCQMPHLPILFPANWAAARSALKELRESGTNHIDAARYRGICEAHHINDPESQKTLSGWLHDLGVILHFHENATLEDFIIINPKWAAKAVYKIMEFAEIKDRDRGRFDAQFLRSVWSKEGYTLPEQTKLEKLMTKDLFEVCFAAREQGRSIFIAPQLLPVQQPDVFEWDAAQTGISYIYLYPFMPKGIIGHLFVQLNEDIETKNGEKVVWKQGAVLAKDGCRAWILEKNDGADGRKTIHIQVQGKDPEHNKFLLRDIRQTLKKIHDERYPALTVFEKIPCPCGRCSTASLPHEFDMEDLENWPVETIQCPKSAEHIPVKRLLGGVLDKTEMEQKKTAEPGAPPIIHIKNEIVMPTPQPQHNPSSNEPFSLYAYLTAFVLVGAFVLTLLHIVDIWKAILGVVAVILLITVLGAFQLMNDQRFSEKSFLELMGMVFKKLPPLSFFSKK